MTLKVRKNLAIKRGLCIITECDKQIKININGQEVDQFPREKPINEK